MCVHLQGLAQLCPVARQSEDTVAMTTIKPTRTRETKDNSPAGFILLDEVSNRTVTTFRRDGQRSVEFHAGPELVGPQEIVIGRQGIKQATYLFW